MPFQVMTTQFSTPPNLYERFLDSVRTHPYKLALIETTVDAESGNFRSESVSFLQFRQMVSNQRRQLDKQGFTVGSRVLVVLPPSIRMYALVSAMFANGVVPVFIDPTMARTQYLRAIQSASLNGVIAVPALLKYWPWIRGLRRPTKFCLDSGGFGYSKWPDFTPSSDELDLPSLPAQSTGLITFTSGSTGIPKAADRTNEILFAQREISKSLWTAGEQDVELTAFPMVVLSNLVYGVTTVLPPFNPQLSDSLWTEITQNLIENFKVTRMALSPFHLDQFSRQPKRAHNLVKRIVVGGAPVPNWLIKKAQAQFPEATGHIVYGSTEAEPISHALFTEAILKDTANGYFVGQVISDLEVRLTNGEVELCGPHVIQRYLFDHKENDLLKFRDANNKIWHKTRDVGVFDADQNLWLKGRYSDRISWQDESYSPYPIEHSIENTLERRAALVQNKKRSPKLVIEYPSASSLYKVESQIREHLPNSIRQIPIECVEKMPVDRRHRWRINRSAL